jgi:hypothetical protein
MSIARSIRWLTRIPNQVLVGLGLALLAATLFLAALIPSKDVAVAVAVAGTFLSTAVLSLFVPRVVGAAKSVELQREWSAATSAARLEEAESQRRQAERKRVEAEREIVRLESMRLHLEAFRPILKLGLLELDTTITDFQYRVISEQDRKSWWRTGTRRVYTGVVQIPVKAHLGVDLQNVRIAEENDRLVVSGLAMTTVADTGQGANWLLDDVRTEYLKENQVVRFKGETHDSQAKGCSREHELQVRARLNQGLDFTVFEVGLIRTAEQMLRILLAPLGKEIGFEPSPRASARPLLEFLGDHDQQLARNIAELKRDLLPDAGGAQ